MGLKIILSLILLLGPIFSWAVVEQAEPPNYILEIPIGAKAMVRDLADYIDTVYRFAVSLAGILAIAMIIVGGFDWVFAGGNDEKIGKAKERIAGALWGLIIILSSYLLLNTINPALVSLKGASIPKILTPGSDKALAELPACNTGIFINSNCKDKLCGEQCAYQGQYCRGIICSTGSCYNDFTDPTNKYKCYDDVNCGNAATECLKENYKDKYIYNDCLCWKAYSSQYQCLKNSCGFSESCGYGHEWNRKNLNYTGVVRCGTIGSTAQYEVSVNALKCQRASTDCPASSGYNYCCFSSDGSFGSSGFCSKSDVSNYSFLGATLASKCYKD